MQSVIREIQKEYLLSESAALRLFDQIFACYATPDDSLVAVERSEYYLPLTPSHEFRRKWIALYPTVIVIVGETHRGTRVLLRIAEFPKLLAN